MTIKIKDPISALTHFIGAVISLVGVVLLIENAYSYASIWHILSFSLFGISLVLLYTASTIYHTIEGSKKVTNTLKRIDHIMIFFLIAGTYTPICLVPLRDTWGWTLLTIIWCIAIAGVLFKAFWINAPRWLSASLYIIMGWVVIIAIRPVIYSLPSGAFDWLLAGGLMYTFGGIIYGLKWPKFTFKNFGFHELFHIFVMGGSFCHFILMYNYILKM